MGGDSPQLKFVFLKAPMPTTCNGKVKLGTPGRGRTPKTAPTPKSSNPIFSEFYGQIFFKFSGIEGDPSDYNIGSLYEILSSGFSKK